jgi:hypothetical protein
LFQEAFNEEAFSIAFPRPTRPAYFDDWPARSTTAAPADHADRSGDRQNASLKEAEAESLAHGALATTRRLHPLGT